MHIELFPIDFQNAGTFLVPTDDALHAMAVEYAKAQLKEKPDFMKLRKAWLVCKVDADNKPIEAVGMVGFSLRPDVHILRAHDGATATKVYRKVFDRLNGFFADQGLTGEEVLIHVDITAPMDELCPNWAQAIQSYGAKPANRFTIKVR